MTSPGPTAYPGPQASVAYPAPQPASSYPAPGLPQGPQFTIDTPVQATATQLQGTGPAGVPIKLISVTQMGAVIAQTTIDANHHFSFAVGGKLTAGDQVGIQLGDTRGTGIDPNGFISGPGYENLPFLGPVFVSTVIQ